MRRSSVLQKYRQSFIICGRHGSSSQNLLLNQNRLIHQIMEIWRILNSTRNSTICRWINRSNRKKLWVLMKLVRIFRSVISFYRRNFKLIFTSAILACGKQTAVVSNMRAAIDEWLLVAGISYWRINEFEKFRENNDWQTNREVGTSMYVNLEKKNSSCKISIKIETLSTFVLLQELPWIFIQKTDGIIRFKTSNSFSTLSSRLLKSSERSNFDLWSSFPSPISSPCSDQCQPTESSRTDNQTSKKSCPELLHTMTKLYSSEQFEILNCVKSIF